MQTCLSLTEHVLIFKCLSMPPGSRTSCLFELRPACAQAANQIEMSQGRTSEWRPRTIKIDRLLNDKPKWLWAPCCWGTGLVHHTGKSSLGSARKPWRCLSKSTAAADHCWESPAVRLGECEVVKFTLVLIGRAGRDILEELQQERLQNVRAAVERCQDVQQPPSPLTAVPARKHTWTDQRRAGGDHAWH